MHRLCREWLDLSKIIEILWEPPDEAVAVGGEGEPIDWLEDLEATFGPMQHSDKEVNSAKIRMFAASAEHAMQGQMLYKVPGVDKGYARVAPMG